MDQSHRGGEQWGGGGGGRLVRLMGLDVGERTIGVAISDPLGITAQPQLTLRRKHTSDDISRLAELKKEKGVEAIVVGLPRRTTGLEGPEAARVRLFAQELEVQLGCRVYFMDERFTTAVAESAMLETGSSRACRRAKIDQVAAAIILQGFLDRQRSQGVGELARE